MRSSKKTPGSARRKIVAAATVVLAILGSFAGATPANAVSFGAITCTLSVQWPHGSSHVAGTVNVVSVAQCTSTMREIYNRSTLHKGSLYWQGVPQDKFNVALLSSNAATSCSYAPGNFYGTASAVFHAPFGYSPSSAVVQAGGATKPVTCGTGASLLASAAPDEAAIAELRAQGYTVTVDAENVTVSKDVVFAASR